MRTRPLALAAALPLLAGAPAPTVAAGGPCGAASFPTMTSAFSL
jgi:hypothetical protein